MRHSTSQRLDVIVVDARPEDYGSLVASMKDTVCFHFAISTDAARQIEPTRPVASWLVNSSFLGVSGSELLAFLHEHWHGCPVSLVADHYSVDDEILARTLGASFFVCKPINPEWFAQVTNGRHQRQQHRQTSTSTE